MSIVSVTQFAGNGDYPRKLVEYRIVQPPETGPVGVRVTKVLDTGNKAQVMCVPRRENSNQGGQLNDFYSRELNQQGGAAFFLIPVPW